MVCLLQFCGHLECEATNCNFINLIGLDENLSPRLVKEGDRAIFEDGKVTFWTKEEVLAHPDRTVEQHFIITCFMLFVTNFI